MNIYKVGQGIEWTNPPGTVAGSSLNPTAGCKHHCMWEMPGGAVVSCYAEDLAGRFNNHYPHGFHHHYWHPERLLEPGKKKTPHGIFVGSMADIYGHWVPVEQIEAILKMCRDCPQHTFFTLTKNPGRMQYFDMPENVWAGCSLPGGPLIPVSNAYSAMMVYLQYMHIVEATVRWLSLEPLWFNVGDCLRWWIENGLSLPFEWVVIGAASKGARFYQPLDWWVQGILDVCDEVGIPVFMKHNLDWPERRMEFPDGVRKEV